MFYPYASVSSSSGIQGSGVFATAPIATGTITYVKDALELEVNPTALEELAPPPRRHVEKYSYVEANGVHVVSRDLAKHVNHSCAANTLSTAWGFEIAIRDIPAGEEITSDYGLFNLAEPMDCRCGTDECRYTIHADDFDLLVDDWDDWIRDAIAHIGLVEQPLLSALDMAVWVEVQTLERYRSVAQKRRFPSLRTRDESDEIFGW